MYRLKTWVAAAAALAVLAGLPFATAAAGTTKTVAVNAPGNANAHLMLTPSGSSALARQYPKHFAGPGMDGTTNMDYHGGSVMRNVTTYVIFWDPTTLPAGYTGATYDSNYRALVERYFNDNGGTPYFNILTQYGDNTGAPVPNATTFGGDW